MKYGRTWGMDGRMNGYRGKYSKVVPLVACKVNDMYEAEKYLGEYLLSHGAIRYGQKKGEWFTFGGSIKSRGDLFRGITLWTKGLTEYDPESVKDIDNIFMNQALEKSIPL